MSQYRILIADDNEDVLFALNLLLESYFEKIKVTTRPERIIELVTSFRPDVILLDMNFSKDAICGEEGFESLKQILTIDPHAAVIFMTAYSDTEKAVRAIKAGAIDFISKPWTKEKILATLSAALKLRQSRQEVTLLKQQVKTLSEPLISEDNIIGESEEMRNLFETVQKLSETDANILIFGENGTGKDIIARMLHQSSNRSDAPFINIDLGSVPEALFESELFGYQQGAFTDAKKPKAGRFEIANGGTLFLDEIGNLSLNMQAKLLTAIEKRKISRLGSTESTAIDVRLISATNADIHEMIEAGAFRQDLLYRINTVELHIPPLRDRGNDILLLAEYFLNKYNKKYHKDIKGITREGKQKLLNYNWPGNVRELQHALERAVILNTEKWINASQFQFKQIVNRRSETEDLNLESIERRTIEKAIKRASGNITQAANYLGITRFALYRKIEKMGL